MRGKHRETLELVFRDPVSGAVEWPAEEALLIAAGAWLIEGRGSRRIARLRRFTARIPQRRRSATRFAPPARFWRELESRAMMNTMTYKGYSARIGYDDEERKGFSPDG